MTALKLGWVVALTVFSSTAWSLTCRPYKADEVGKGYILPWISGISRLVTASNCSSINSYHTSSAVYLHKINDATFAYDFRMRYEPVCMMRPGWIIEFRDTEPDLEGKRIRGRSNFLKILTPDNRVDYYTHLRNSWWTEVGQAEFNFVHRKQQTLALKNAGNKVRWVTYADGRKKLIRGQGGDLTFPEMQSLARDGYLEDLYVPHGHCIAYSGSSGTNAPHLHVESRCSLHDSRTCPIEFQNAYPVRAVDHPELGVLKERQTYLAR